MKRLLRTPVLALVLGTGIVSPTIAGAPELPLPGAVPVVLPGGPGGCGAGGCDGGGLATWNNNLGTTFLERPPSWDWYFPYGGYTVYPGEPGSCCAAHSDYSHVNWVVGPSVTAKGVLAKLESIGIPVNAPPTQFLGKNPCLPDKLLLPTPGAWMKEREKLKDEMERRLQQERERKEKEKLKKGDNDLDPDDKPKEKKDPKKGPKKGGKKIDQDEDLGL